MSPPIYTPDGQEVTEIVLPDGSTASEVVAPDGSVVFEAGPDIPDSGLLHYYPGDEGSGSTLTDNEGSADFSLSGPSWVSRSDYEGGFGLFFDGAGDSGSATLTQPTARTRFLRIEVSSFSSLSNNLRVLFGHGFEPLIGYQVLNEDWEYRSPDNNAEVLVPEPIGDVEGSTRVLVARMDTSQMKFEVYDGSGETLVGDGTALNPDTSYEGTTAYLGQAGNDTRWLGAMEADPQFLTYDHYKTDSEVQDVLEAAFS